MPNRTVSFRKNTVRWNQVKDRYPEGFNDGLSVFENIITTARVAVQLHRQGHVFSDDLWESFEKALITSEEFSKHKNKRSDLGGF